MQGGLILTFPNTPGVGRNHLESWGLGWLLQGGGAVRWWERSSSEMLALVWQSC